LEDSKLGIGKNRENKGGRSEERVGSIDLKKINVSKG